MTETRRNVLTLVAAGIKRPARHLLKDLEANDLHPRVTFFGDTLNSDELDEEFLKRVHGFRGRIYKFLPTPLAQVLEAYFLRKNYDAIISWSEPFGLQFELLLKLTGARVPHVALFGWPAKGKKAFLLRRVYTHIDRIMMWSTVQREKVLNEIGVPSDKISFIKWPVDQKFFRPVECDTDMIFAVGNEMRDYPTFLEAMKGLDIPCHIAAGTLIEKKSKWASAIERRDDLPASITVGKKTQLELRKLYARARFVVIPLHQTETDNGITCILEAFAMGKPVICSHTIGQVDVIEDGKTGIFVPVGDTAALRKAILFLWNNPAEAKRLGEAARRYVDEHATLEQFVEAVQQEVERSIEAHGNIHATGIGVRETLRSVS
ncbi:MAG: glycosyltransferase family 4 protein [Ignavibacteriae bacterium]|nr:glycosyltransferase family 4 protein [Ignavibacteriota bacterium]